MNDAGQPIQINITTAPIAITERGKGGTKFVLGYITGEFSKIITTGDLFVTIWFQRGVEMALESVTYKLNNGSKAFRQRIQESLNEPQGLVVSTFYVEMYGWITPDPEDSDLTAEFELTNFEVSVKTVNIGKFGGEIQTGTEIQISPRPGSSGNS